MTAEAASASEAVVASASTPASTPPAGAAPAGDEGENDEDGSDGRAGHAPLEPLAAVGAVQSHGPVEAEALRARSPASSAPSRSMPTVVKQQRAERQETTGVQPRRDVPPRGRASEGGCFAESAMRALLGSPELISIAYVACASGPHAMSERRSSASCPPFRPRKVVEYLTGVPRVLNGRGPDAAMHDLRTPLVDGVDTGTSPFKQDSSSYDAVPPPNPNGSASERRLPARRVLPPWQERTLLVGGVLVVCTLPILLLIYAPRHSEGGALPFHLSLGCLLIVGWIFGRAADFLLGLPPLLGYMAFGFLFRFVEGDPMTSARPVRCDALRWRCRRALPAPVPPPATATATASR
jgi:hypothetical protein